MEKIRLNADWISPQDSEIENNGSHVARTGNPEEDQEIENDAQFPKMRFFRRRHKNPEIMTVERGKKNKKTTTN